MSVAFSVCFLDTTLLMQGVALLSPVGQDGIGNGCRQASMNMNMYIFVCDSSP